MALIVLALWQPVYALHLAIMIGIFMLLSHSLNLVLGYGGLISFVHAAFYGIGAYTYGLVSVAMVKSKAPAGVTPVVALAAAIVLTVAVSGFVGWVSLRFRGDLFIFTTLGFHIVIFDVIYNWVAVTGGPYGLSGIPPIRIGTFTVRTLSQFALVVAVCCTLLLAGLLRCYRSFFGLSLKAIRDDERAAVSIGIAPSRQYLTAFVIAAAVAAVAGALFAAYVGYLDPSSFSVRESVFLVTILLLGGSGNFAGPTVGVLLMLLLPEILRFFGLPDTMAANTREIIYGGVLMALMFLRPRGMAGDYAIR